MGKPFNKKTCKPAPEGEDPVDDVRVLVPTKHRFVLCGPGDKVIDRFILLEDANAAARQQPFKTTVYAIKSGAAMSHTTPAWMRG